MTSSSAGAARFDKVAAGQRFFFADEPAPIGIYACSRAWREWRHAGRWLPVCFTAAGFEEGRILTRITVSCHIDCGDALPTAGAFGNGRSPIFLTIVSSPIWGCIDDGRLRCADLPQGSTGAG